MLPQQSPGFIQAIGPQGVALLLLEPGERLSFLIHFDLPHAGQSSDGLVAVTALQGHQRLLQAGLIANNGGAQFLRLAPNF
jgi:hypothetical protein